MKNEANLKKNHIELPEKNDLNEKMYWTSKQANKTQVKRVNRELEAKVEQTTTLEQRPKKREKYI